MKNIISFAGILLATVLQTGALEAQVVNFNNYAQNAPGTQFLERGNMFFRQGDYDAAVGNFRLAAHWADKLAQFNLGMMYVNGDGVDRDPLRGWAWIKLSAERGYPKNAAVAADIRNQFTDEHRKVAKKILEKELKPRFGDEVAIPRTSNEMKRMLARDTSGGSRVGVNRAIYVTGRDGTFVSGDQFFRDELWNFEKIVRFETRLHKAIGDGNVILRDFQTLEDGEPAPQSSDAEDSESGE
ncbi:MAG: sel1 repeat family protein [Wenzhouxiangellaceae bacterium]|nr:sel1 repeat family protein [Wenzhouxiangellaceae bacterium]